MNTPTLRVETPRPQYFDVQVEKRGEWTKEYLIEEHKALISAWFVAQCIFSPLRISSQEKLAAAKIQEEERVKEESHGE